MDAPQIVAGFNKEAVDTADSAKESTTQELPT